MNSHILKVYFEKSGLTISQLQDKVHKNFDKFLTGEKVPTFNQLIKIAKAFSIPVGLLMLDQPLEKEREKISFRTINTEFIFEQSKELQDTIEEMRFKQEFLRREIYNNLDFVGKFSIEDNYLKVAEYIRETINIEKKYYLTLNKANIFKVLRNKINAIGVFVFLNGKVKDNTHRPLELNEFRGFVLADKKAPIIFINQKDAKNGQLFTLIHELVHLFIGDEEILGNQNSVFDFDPTEAFANKVTAEILVPMDDFLEKVESTHDTEALSSYFKVSEFVIVRRLLDCRKINKSQYSQKIDELTKKYSEIQRKRKGNTSNKGDYNNNLQFRIDSNFFKYVDNALINNKITYTDAFSILGVGYKGFKTLKERNI